MGKKKNKSKNKKTKKIKHRYMYIPADKSPYTMDMWNEEVAFMYDNDIDEIFIEAVKEMKLEKVKFMLNSGFMDFNNECPYYMQDYYDDEHEYVYGSIFDKAIYECLNYLLYTDCIGSMDIFNALLNSGKINYNLLFISLPFCFEYFEKKFVYFIKRIDNDSTKIFSILDKHLVSIYYNTEDSKNFILKFNKYITDNNINIDYFPNLFISACWSDNEEFVKFFIENDFNYNIKFNKELMDEIILSDNINYDETVIKVAYNLSKLEGIKIQHFLETLMDF